MVCENMYNLKRMMENTEELKQLGIKVEISGNEISVSKAADPFNYDWYLFNLYGSVEEFNVFCDMLLGMVHGSNRLIELAIKLREEQATRTQSAAP